MNTQLKPLMVVQVELEPIVSAGATPSGEIRVVPFVSGTFEGAGLRGKLLPGGSDWQRVRADGVLEISAHYLLETDQGERIEVISQGLRHAAPEVMARLAAGEAVARDEYYFRTAIRLTTAAPRLTRLNQMLVVSVGERTKSAVRLELFEVP
jgi:hypothetical protein